MDGTLHSLVPRSFAVGQCRYAKLHGAPGRTPAGLGNRSLIASGGITNAPQPPKRAHAIDGMVRTCDYHFLSLVVSNSHLKKPRFTPNVIF